MAICVYMLLYTILQLWGKAMSLKLEKKASTCMKHEILLLNGFW